MRVVGAGRLLPVNVACADHYHGVVLTSEGIQHGSHRDRRRRTVRMARIADGQVDDPGIVRDSQLECVVHRALPELSVPA